MQIINATSSPCLTIVCCVHGNETFGLDVFNHFRSEAHRDPRLTLILANEEAIAANRRFLETDLNRCFPGRPDGTHEERIAARLLPAVTSSPLLLDIHTTTTGTALVPIVAKLNDEVRGLLRHVPAELAVMMDEGFGERSLIAQAPAAVSLEFGEEYARTGAALRDTIAVVTAVLDTLPSEARQLPLYHVTRAVGRSEANPDDLRDFRLDERLGGYPFLAGEANYPDLACLLATRREMVEV